MKRRVDGYVEHSGKFVAIPRKRAVFSLNFSVYKVPKRCVFV
jgi:hypothetical protein